MTFKEIKDLVRLVNQSELAELKIKDGEFELSIRTNEYYKTKPQGLPSPVPSPVYPVQGMPMPAAPNAPAASSNENVASDFASPKSDDKEGGDTNANLVAIKSPIVGTFYRSSNPDSPVYVKVGDTIGVGDVVCIVEAMKLFNEIESEVSGKVVKVLVDDASPVEYDQVLFLVDPS